VNRNILFVFKTISNLDKAVGEERPMTRELVHRGSPENKGKAPCLKHNQGPHAILICHWVVALLEVLGVKKQLTI